MKSKKVKVGEAKFVVDKDELEDVKDDFNDDDVVKVVDLEEEEIEDEDVIEESLKGDKEVISEMISDSLVDRVVSGEHSLKDNPSLPKLSGEDYLLKLVDDKYESIAKEIKVNTGKDFVDFTDILPSFGRDLNNISLYEENYKEELVKLAIDIIKEEFDLDESDITFDAEIVTDITDINNDDEVIYSPINGDDIDLLQGEIHKRRIMNALIQGGARDLADYFKMKKSEISDIDTKLYNLYRNVMPIGDLMYFTEEDDVNATKTGSLSIVKDGEVPVIIARAVNFPMLLFQLGKGMFELLLGEDASDRFEYIKSKADKDEFESDDIRLGLSIYNKILSEIDSNDSRVKYLVLNTLSKVRVPEFHKMMKDILGNTIDGKNYIKRIVTGVKNKLKEFDNQGDIYESGYIDPSEVDSLDFGV